MNTFDVGNRFQGGYTKPRKSTEYIVIHHAAGLYPQKNGIEDVAAVARFHTDAEPRGRGWPGIGYNWALAEEFTGGNIALYKFGRPDLERAHVWGQNHRSFGISCLTNFTSDPSDRWMDALARAVVEARKMYPNAKIVGHKDIALDGHKTECPGPTWYRWKIDLLDRVKDLEKGVTVDNPQVIGVGPKIDRAKWHDILSRHSARLSVAERDRCYDMCTWMDIDPAFVIALWIREGGSPLGGSELQKQTNCPINIKAASDEWRPTIVYKGVKWLAFESQQLGLIASIIHLKNVHGWSGRLHVKEILHTHAPPSENDTDAVLNALLIDWRSMTGG